MNLEHVIIQINSSMINYPQHFSSTLTSLINIRILTTSDKKTKQVPKKDYRNQKSEIKTKNKIIPPGKVNSLLPWVVLSAVYFQNVLFYLHTIYNHLEWKYTLHPIDHAKHQASIYTTSSLSPFCD